MENEKEILKKEMKRLNMLNKKIEKSIGTENIDESAVKLIKENILTMCEIVKTFSEYC